MRIVHIPAELLSGQTVPMCIRCGLVEGAETDGPDCPGDQGWS